MEVPNGAAVFYALCDGQPAAKYWTEQSNTLLVMSPVMLTLCLNNCHWNVFQFFCPRVSWGFVLIEQQAKVIGLTFIPYLF